MGQSTTINCTLGDDTTFIGWNIQFIDLNTTVSVKTNNSPFPGVAIVKQSGLSMLTLNTSNTSITSVSCLGAQLSAGSSELIEPRVCVTIYGKFTF